MEKTMKRNPLLAGAREPVFYGSEDFTVPLGGGGIVTPLTDETPDEPPVLYLPNGDTHKVAAPTPRKWGF